MAIHRVAILNRGRVGKGRGGGNEDGSSRTHIKLTFECLRVGVKDTVSGFVRKYNVIGRATTIITGTIITITTNIIIIRVLMIF